MGRRLGLVGVGALTLGLSGCFWPAPGGGPDRAGHNPFEAAITPATVGDLGVAWVAATGGGPVLEDPVVSDAGVHVSVQAGPTLGADTLFTFDAATGAPRWQKDGSGAFAGPAVFADGDLWVGFQRTVVASAERLDPATGATRSVLSAPGWVEGVRGDTYVVSRYISGTGATGPAIQLAVRDASNPSAGWSKFIDFLQPGQPDALPTTLGRDHVYQAGPGVLLSPGNPPARGNGIRAYSTTTWVHCANILPAAEASWACPVWSTPLPGAGATPPVLGDDGAVVFTATDTGTVFAIDAATGAVLWSTPIGAPVEASPALADGILFVPTDTGEVVAMDASTGAVSWSGVTGSAVATQPAVAGGVVFVGSADGSVHAFDAAGCELASCASLWSHDTGDAPIAGGLAVSNGQLYAGTSDGRLIAYELT